MLEVYGEGSSKFAPSYYINENGELESDDADHTDSIPNKAPGFPHYWFSTVTGTEVLSSAAQERYIEYYTSNDPVIKRDAVLAYLRNTPTVHVSCMAWNNSNTSQVVFAADQFVHILQRFED